MTRPKATINSEPTAHTAGKVFWNGVACRVCLLPTPAVTAINELLAKGEPITAVERWAKKTFVECADVTYMSIRNHKLSHVEKKIRASKKLSDRTKLQKAETAIAKAVLEDRSVDPAVYFAPTQLAMDIKRTNDRLELAADAALEDGEFSPLASLSGVLIRSAELRAKMGGSIAGEQTNITVNIGALHEKLDAIVGGGSQDRQSAAMALLGMGAGPVIDVELDPQDKATIERQALNPRPK